MESYDGKEYVMSTARDATVKRLLGLKLTQSSPLFIFESLIVTVSLRSMSHPSVFLARFFDVDTELIVILL